MESKEVNTRDEELHLFILWSNARDKEKEILHDIGEAFTIRRVFDVAWPKKTFDENLSRFYGTSIPGGIDKGAHAGRGDFLLVVVDDHEPDYDHHETSKGTRHVNSKMFLAKQSHREWTGGGHKVHATDTITETDHDLALLLGLNTHDFNEKYPGSETKPIKWKKPLVGADGWESLEQLLYTFNATTDYVVLRNFDMLPGEYYAEQHGDIDLMVRDYELANIILGGKAVFPEDHRVHKSVQIAGEEVLFDLRFKGDEYYDEQWQEEILATRELHPNGFYIPSNENHAQSLLYHALIHKPAVNPDYVEQLERMFEKPIFDGDVNSLDQAKSILAKFMAKKDYRLTTAVDISVYKHEQNFSDVWHVMRKTRPAHYALKRAKRLLKN